MQEAAERAARSKSDIVATLSHEIRNGLTGVTHVLAAAAGKGGRAAPSREQLNAALDAAQDLVAVLNATLDPETAESGRLLVESVAFEPVRLIRDLVLLDRPHAVAKGLELVVHVEPDLERPPAGRAPWATPLRTRQIIANIVGNAVKYTVRGRIEVRVERRENLIAIEVADTGPGLSREELDQAFLAFQRVERTGAGVTGAGLGLSLSRQLARLMGGALDATSAVGVGSAAFTLTLPFDENAIREIEPERDDAAGRRGRRRPAPQPADPDRRGRRPERGHAARHPRATGPPGGPRPERPPRPGPGPHLRLRPGDAGRPDADPGWSADRRRPARPGRPPIARCRSWR